MALGDVDFVDIHSWEGKDFEVVFADKVFYVGVEVLDIEGVHIFCFSDDAFKVVVIAKSWELEKQVSLRGIYAYDGMFSGG